LAELQDEPVRAGLSTIWREIDRLNVTVKKPYTPMNNADPTSPPSGDAGSPYGTCARIGFSMNVA
jgi:hypothetical protein